MDDPGARGRRPAAKVAGSSGSRMDGRSKDVAADHGRGGGVVQQRRQTAKADDRRGGTNGLRAVPDHADRISAGQYAGRGKAVKTGPSGEGGLPGCPRHRGARSAAGTGRRAQVDRIVDRILVGPIQRRSIMSRVVLLLVLVALWMFPHKCRAQVAEPAGQTDAAIKGAAGINGVWFDANGSVPPSDFEVGAVARASGQHHLSLVGAVWYGIDHSYLRAVIGPVVTATDVDDRNF